MIIPFPGHRVRGRHTADAEPAGQGRGHFPEVDFRAGARRSQAAADQGDWHPWLPDRHLVLH